MGVLYLYHMKRFEKFFNDFGKSVSDYYELFKLTPAYQVYFKDNESVTIADNLADIKTTFESIEKSIFVFLIELLLTSGQNNKSRSYQLRRALSSSRGTP
mgnify:CR=1 FL=1